MSSSTAWPCLAAFPCWQGAQTRNVTMAVCRLLEATIHLTCHCAAMGTDTAKEIPEALGACGHAPLVIRIAPKCLIKKSPLAAGFQSGYTPSNKLHDRHLRHLDSSISAAQFSTRAQMETCLRYQDHGSVEIVGAKAVGHTSAAVNGYSMKMRPWTPSGHAPLHRRARDD